VTSQRRSAGRADDQDGASRWLTGAAFGLVCAAGRMPVASVADSGYEPVGNGQRPGPPPGRHPGRTICAAVVPVGPGRRCPGRALSRNR
jgi:hypothetical protein